ncbi:hypothetical protein EJ110_NYTH39774 [Nymphaea thermarum]|nr:hypothetical protein EJ110_NYTH39774 [Nymphaea thermarum]
MLGLFLLGCTGVVVFLHGANVFYHYLSSRTAVRALRRFDAFELGNEEAAYTLLPVRIAPSGSFLDGALLLIPNS